MYKPELNQIQLNYAGVVTRRTQKNTCKENKIKKKH